MTNRGNDTGPRFGRVKDLSVQLNQQTHRLTEVVLGIARTWMHDARYAEALELLDSDLLALLETDVPSTDAVRIRIARAAVLDRRSRDSGEGRDAVMNYVDEIEAAVAACGDKRALAEYLRVKADAVMDRELMEGRSYDASLDLSERAHALFEEVGDLRGVAESLFRIGLVYEFRREEVDRKQRADTPELDQVAVVPVAG